MDLMSFMITRYISSLPLLGSIPSLLLFSLHLYSASYRGTRKMLHSVFRILMRHFQPTLDPSGLDFPSNNHLVFLCSEPRAPS